jgi:hypothetical protein
MADTEVVDIIHRLTYESNTAELAKGLEALENQTKAIDRQVQSYARLERIFNETAENEIEKRNRLKAAMEARAKSILNEIQALERQYATNSRLQTQLDRNASSLQRLYSAQRAGGATVDEAVAGTDRFRNAQFALTQILREAPSAANGFQVFLSAISNNMPILVDQIQALSNQGIRSGEIFANLGKSLFSLNNILTIGITILTVFGDKLFNSEDETDKLAEKQKKLAAAIREVNNEILQQIKQQNEAILLESNRVDIGTNSEKRRLELLQATGAINGETFKSETDIYNQRQALTKRELQDLEVQKATYVELREEIYRVGTAFKERAKYEGQYNEEFQAFTSKTLQETLKIPKEVADKEAEQIVKTYNTKDGVQKLFIKNITEFNEQIKGKNNELLAQQIEFVNNQLRRQYELSQELRQKIGEQEYQRRIQAYETEKAIFGDSLELIKKRVDADTANQVKQVQKQREDARKQGALNAENERLFGQQINNIRRLADEEYRRARFEFLTDLYRRQIQYYQDVAALELDGANKELKLLQDIGDDTLATRREIAQKETENEINAINKRYNDLFEAARKNGQDTTQLAKDQEHDLEVARLQGNRRQLAAEESYFNDQKKLIEQDQQFRINALKAGARLRQDLSKQIARENLRSAREELSEAVKLRDRVAADPNSTIKDLQEAQDKVNQAQIKINGFLTDIQKGTDKNIQAIISAYKSLETALSAVFNSIYQRQIELLDREIEYRKNRIDYAVELANRGNTQILEDEQKKIDAAQQERERVAQRQLEVNAILQASNSAVALTEAIGAVVKAAAEGDPYTIAARVAAAVAALVAGVAAVSTAFGSINKGFYDGGYTGDGDPHAPAGTVHKGEFVSTAATTRKYRPLLEALHRGQTLTLPMLSPYLNLSTDQGNSKDMKDVKKELSRIGDAVESIESPGIKFDSNGVAVISINYDKRSRKRWKN